MSGASSVRAAAAFWLLVLAPPATAAAEGQVAFSALREGRWEVYLADGSGKPPVRVDARQPGDASAPALSADGSRLAFETPGRGILVCALADDSCEQVTGAGTARPAWDPSGERLIFARYVVSADKEDSDLFVLAADSDEPASLLREPGNQDHPDVSPDGRLVVFSSARTLKRPTGGFEVRQSIRVHDLESAETRTVVPEGAENTQPDWSPDGKRIAFASNRSGAFEIWCVDADGSRLRQITSGAGAKLWPAFSPDGERIMYTLVTAGRQSLWTVGLDGSSPRPFEPFGEDSPARELRDADWR